MSKATSTERGEDKIHMGQAEGDTTIGRRKHTVTGKRHMALWLHQSHMYYDN